MGDRLVACLTFPGLAGRPELERFPPEVEVTVVQYLEEVARRNGRHTMSLEEMRATAPPLPEELRTALARAEVMLALDVPVDLASLAPNLRWLQLGTAGIDHLSGTGVFERDVVVTNASGIGAPAIAEFVIGSLLAQWKRLYEIRESQRAREWSATFGRTFRGSVVGVVGTGAIGSAVAVRARALGARVLGIRRSASPADGVDEMLPPDRLHELLARSDAVVLAAPGGDETRHLIDRAALALMKEGGVLVNVSRGSLVDEKALVDALRTGRLRGAILDVFEREPLPRESPLWDFPNVQISAHCSVALDRYFEDVLELFEENLERYRRGEPLRNVVGAS